MKFQKPFLKVIAVVFGTLISVAMVATVFFSPNFSGEGPFLVPRFRFGTFLADLPRHVPWLLAFSVLTGSMIPARAFQWQAALKHPVPFKERYHFVAIGAFVHNALPGKMGDVFRAFLLGRTWKLPFMQSLGSVAVCKLFEFAALMMLVGLSFLGPFGSTMKSFGTPVRVAALVCLALMVAVVLLARNASRLSAYLLKKGKFPKLQPHLAHISRGLGAVKTPKDMGVTFLSSVPPVLVNALAYGLALHAMGVKGGVFAGAVVLGAIALGQAAPGLPAGTGIYYLVTSWSARSLGAAPEDAAAFSTLTHMATLATQLSVGAVSVWLRKIRWRDLKAAPVEGGQGFRQGSTSSP